MHEDGDGMLSRVTMADYEMLRSRGHAVGQLFCIAFISQKSKKIPAHAGKLQKVAPAYSYY